MRPELGRCWTWTGFRSSGYGFLSVGNRPTRAHRVSWELSNGPLPDIAPGSYHGTCVLHRCDNRACVRPDHLFIGTQLDNIRDRDAKLRGRSGPGFPRGERHPNHKLRACDVREIRRRYAAGGITQFALAAEFGVRQPHISRAISGTAWGHVR